MDKAASIIQLLMNYILLSHELYAFYTYNTQISKQSNISNSQSIPSTIRIPCGNFFQLCFDTDRDFICCSYFRCFLRFLHFNFIWNKSYEDVLVTEVFSLLCSKLHKTRVWFRYVSIESKIRYQQTLAAKWLNYDIEEDINTNGI